MRVLGAFPSRAVDHFGSQGFKWQEGEWHETRSLEPSILLLVEGAFE
jgi:hypothetical protein